MLESNNIKHRRYSVFDSMSTEKLEDILKADAQLDRQEESDTEAILYIMEVIAKREKDQPTGRFTDVQTAWNSFEKNYLPYIDNDKSIYEFEDSGVDVVKKPTQKSFHLIWKQPMIRIVSSAAILVVLLLTGNMTAKAFGIDLFGMVATWTGDTFGFTSSVPQGTTTNVQGSKETVKDLKNILEEYGVSSDLVPTWIPDRYSFKETNIYESPLRTTFYTIYTYEEDEMAITITMMSEPVPITFEKDDNDVIVYSVDDVKHYIMTNLDITNVVWVYGNYECSISGKFSTDEAKKMIDSIYEEK